MKDNPLLVTVVIILVLKIIINGLKLIQCKCFLKEYFEWINAPDWSFVQDKHKIIKLLQDAGVKDSKVPINNFIGLGMLQTGNVSLFSNFPSSTKDFTIPMIAKFNHAIGVYKSRLLETFNPIFWIEFVLKLPKHIFSYCGVSADAAIVRIIQVLYWIGSIIFSLLLYAFSDEISSFIKSIIPLVNLGS